jgi:hypothetical protein
MSNLIQSMIRDLSLVGWYDFRAGHVQDIGPWGNHGSIQGNCVWEGDGLRFVDNTAYVEVAHHASLNLTDATMVLLKPKMRNHALAASAHNVYILNKRVGGAGTQWNFYLSATNRLLLNDGVVTRWSPVIYYDDERYVALSLAGGGGTAIGYREGLSVGNFSGANTLPINTHNLRISIPNADTYDGTIQSAMIINRVLTAAEHAVLYQELAELQFPTSTWGFAKFEQDVFKREPGLVSGWDMRPAGGVVPDQAGANDGTIVGCPMYAPGILGDAMRFDGVKDYIDCGNVGTIKAVAFWTKPETNTEDFLDLDGGVHTVEVAAGTVTATGWVAPIIFVDGVATTALVAGLKQRVVVSTATAFAANAVKLGTETIYLEGTMGAPEFFSTERDATWAADDYLAGAQAIQWQSDWGFQVSPAAEGGTIHGQIGTRSSPFRAGDAVGRWKIETDTVDGQLCKVLTCMTAGMVYIPASLFFDTTPTEACFGTFRCWMSKADASTLTWKFAGTDLDAAANGYAFVWAADESVVISELGVGNIIAGGSASHSTWHRFDATRASDSDFDGYIDETTFGNGNDLTITTSIGMLWDMDAGDKIALNPSGIIKRLGVFPP